MCTVSYYPYFCLFAFIFNSTANTHIYSYIHTLSLLYALPIYFCTRAPLSSFWTRSGGRRSHMPANRHRRERHGPCARRAGALPVPTAREVHRKRPGVVRAQDRCRNIPSPALPLRRANAAHSETRKHVCSGNRVPDRVDLGGARTNTKQK